MLPLTHLLDSNPHQMHALHGYMMYLGSSAPHSLSTVKMPVPPTPSFYKLKWILHSAKLSTLKCMVKGHLAPLYCRQPLPLSSSRVSPLFQMEPFSHLCCQTPSLLLLSLWQMLIPSCVCGFTDIWIAAQGSTWLLMSPCSVCICLYTHPLVHIQRP